MKNAKNAIENRFICKLFGERDHDFMEIENEKLKIHKTKIVQNEKKAQITNWTFELDQIYQEDIDFNEIYENEIVCSDFFSELYIGLKGTFIFVSKENDNLFSDYLSQFIKSSVNDIFAFRERNGSKMKNVSSFVPFFTVSFVEFNKNKIIDLFNFERKDDEFLLPKIFDYEDEIVIDKVKEIQISSSENLDFIFNLLQKKRLSYSQKGNANANVSFFSTPKCKREPELLHQLFTIKLYKSENSTCVSKINFLLYKAYSLYSTGIEMEKEYQIFTKENYLFFQSLHSEINFRCCSAIKMIRDTLMGKNNICFIMLPSSIKYIVLVHDILNYIKMRKTSCESIELFSEDKLIEKFNSFSLNSSEGKENNSYALNTSQKASTMHTLNLSKITLSDSFHSIAGRAPLDNHPANEQSNNFTRSQLNIPRLKKIENKNIVKAILDRFNDIANDR